MYRTAGCVVFYPVWDLPITSSLKSLFLRSSPSAAPKGGSSTLGPFPGIAAALWYILFFSDSIHQRLPLEMRLAHTYIFTVRSLVFLTSNIYMDKHSPKMQWFKYVILWLWGMRTMWRKLAAWSKRKSSPTRPICRTRSQVSDTGCRVVFDWHTCVWSIDLLINANTRRCRVGACASEDRTGNLREE